MWTGDATTVLICAPFRSVQGPQARIAGRAVIHGSSNVALSCCQSPATSLKYLQRRDCNGVDLDLLPLNLTKTK